MDTTRLTSLVTAAELGSLSAAARQLGAQLSTISRHITDLEAEIGEPLLLRTGRGVRPTPAGEPFIERARFVLRELDAAVAEARGDRARSVASLRISAPTELALSLLPACLVRFRARFPEVAVDVHSEARRVSLLEEDFDAALRLGRLASSELIARRLGEVRLLLCAAPGTAPARLRPAALDRHAFVGVAGVTERVIGTVRGRRVPLPAQPRLRVSTFTEAAEIATASDLLAILPAYTAERYLRAGTLQRLAPTLTLPAVPVHMLIARHHRGTTALGELATIIGDALRALSS